MIEAIAALVVIGMLALGYWLAGRWWKGGLRWAMGMLFGVIFCVILMLACCVVVLSFIGVAFAGCGQMLSAPR